MSSACPPAVRCFHKRLRGGRGVCVGAAAATGQQQQHAEGSQQQQQQQQQQQHEPRSPLIELMEDRGARLTTAAQMAWAQVLRPGDTAVDATCGNGHDTLALAELVGPSGRVWGFDVQDAALASTRERLSTALPPNAAPELHLVNACHSRLQEMVGSCCARVVAFNLGYLPSGDKGLITKAETTVAALEAALEVLQPGGLLTVMAYTGHPGGMDEYNAVISLLSDLSPAYFVTSETRLVNRPTAPILLVAWRRSDATAAGGDARVSMQRRGGGGRGAK